MSARGTSSNDTHRYRQTVPISSRLPEAVRVLVVGCVVVPRLPVGTEKGDVVGAEFGGCSVKGQRIIEGRERSVRPGRGRGRMEESSVGVCNGAGRGSVQVNGRLE